MGLPLIFNDSSRGFPRQVQHLRLQITYDRFLTSPYHINNCPTRCNTKQSIYYSASSLYMFRVSNTPIIRNTRTVTTASGTVQLPPSNVAKLAWPHWREVAAQNIWPVPGAVVTVLCTPDDGCGWQPKHVQWTCRIINRLLCVASRWTIINIDQRCTEP